jgi:hypothetical protein
MSQKHAGYSIKFLSASHALETEPEYEKKSKQYPTTMKDASSVLFLLLFLAELPRSTRSSVPVIHSVFVSSRHPNYSGGEAAACHYSIHRRTEAGTEWTQKDLQLFEQHTRESLEKCTSKNFPEKRCSGPTGSGVLLQMQSAKAPSAGATSQDQRPLSPKRFLADLAEEDGCNFAKRMAPISVSDPSYSDQAKVSDDYFTRTGDSTTDAPVIEASLCGVESTECTGRSEDDSCAQGQGAPLGDWELRPLAQGGQSCEQARKGAKWEQQWESVFNELVHFEQMFGHALVPRGAVGSRWNSLGQWVRHQRLMLKKGKMAVQRFERLSSLKFCWEEKDLGWEKMFSQLVKYRAENGHSNVAQCDTLLGKWVSLQRLLHRRNGLRKDRQFRLEVLGFQWEVRVPWYQNLMELMLFRQRTGTCEVPTSQPRLLRWVSQQRTFCAKDKISSERLRMLEGVGLEVDIHSSWWERNLVAMMAFRMHHGHLNVPTSREHFNLVQWLHRQRSRFRRGELKKWRYEKLTQLGLRLRYNSRTCFWNDRYAELLNFRDAHGHTNVPTAYSQNPVLAQWVLNQRARHKRGDLSSDRVAMLDAIEFCWDAANHVATLERYRHSNSDVPRRARRRAPDARENEALSSKRSESASSSGVFSDDAPKQHATQLKSMCNNRRTRVSRRG